MKSLKALVLGAVLVGMLVAAGCACCDPCNPCCGSFRATVCDPCR